MLTSYLKPLFLGTLWAVLSAPAQALEDDPCQRQIFALIQSNNPFHYSSTMKCPYQASTFDALLAVDTYYQSYNYPYDDHTRSHAIDSATAVNIQKYLGNDLYLNLGARAAVLSLRVPVDLIDYDQHALYYERNMVLVDQMNLLYKSSHSPLYMALGTMWTDFGDSQGVMSNLFSPGYTPMQAITILNEMQASAGFVTPMGEGYLQGSASIFKESEFRFQDGGDPVAANVLSIIPSEIEWPIMAGTNPFANHVLALNYQSAKDHTRWLRLSASYIDNYILLSKDVVWTPRSFDMFEPVLYTYYNTFSSPGYVKKGALFAHAELSHNPDKYVLMISGLQGNGKLISSDSTLPGGNILMKYTTPKAYELSLLWKLKEQHKVLWTLRPTYFRSLSSGKMIISQERIWDLRLTAEHKLRRFLNHAIALGAQRVKRSGYSSIDQEIADDTDSPVYPQYGLLDKTQKNIYLSYQLRY